MNTLDLKILLLRKNQKQSKIAESLKVTRPSVCEVVNGHHRSKLIEAGLAAAVGLKPIDIFPLQNYEK